MSQTLALTLRSPEMLAPARMPVAAGKKMAKTEKNVSPSRNSGRKFSFAIDSVSERNEGLRMENRTIHSSNWMSDFLDVSP